MRNKDRIKQLEKEVEELEEESEYYKGECNSFWADLRKMQKFNLEIARKIVKTDSKAIANIILNMYFGKMPSDSCRFCEIFDLKGRGCCKEDLCCTDCIDNFLRQHYSGESQVVCGRMGEKEKMNNDLISRSALLQSLRGNVLVDVTPDLEQAVEEQPTAYDVDKVVERLEGMGTGEVCILEDGKYHLIRREEAIETVKSGAETGIG